MSVHTTCDDRLEDAAASIKEAVHYLEEAIDEDTWGSDTLSDTFKEGIIDSIAKLRKMKILFKYYM